MGFGDDDDILQDFLVEAGEILEHLSEQLVELEQRPEDRDLLNAIFRGFHTVKGGAGFLQFDAMVECCHVTENLFDMLRTGKRNATPEMMDVVLNALDTINEQYRQISQYEPPQPADPKLIAALEGFVNGEDSAAKESKPAPATSPAATDSAPTGDEISDQEFEDLLDAINPSAEDKNAAAEAAPKEEKPPTRSASTSTVNVDVPASDGDEISEEEFEALLDQLHGKGKGPSATDAPPPPPAATPTLAIAPVKASDSTNNGEEITDIEFEALLDQLHGKGNGPGVKKADSDVPPAVQSPDSEALITEQEFEDLLDQLHGKGKGPGPTDGSDEADKSRPTGDRGKATAINIGAARETTNTSAAQSSEKVAVSGGQSSATAPKPSTPAVPARPTTDAAATKASKPKESGNQSSVAAAETTVRVDTQRLDDIMNMVGELVLVRNRLVRLGVDSSDEALSKAVANLDVVTADLQTSVMKTRMQPIKKVFGRFPRVVRDLARNLKKEINLELQGEDTDLDKNLVEALADPLVHLVRNAVDHGIEHPAEREKVGKSRVGKVVLAAEQEGDHILLSITDDGAGMDPDALRRKAVEKGVLDEDAVARLSDAEAFNLIFAPGFSTKTEISDVSGRGVGMDVVKTKITQLNGSIDIASKIGEGSRITIKVPLTLAIMPTLMIMLDEQTFALPLVSVNEIFQMDLTKANIVDGQECVTIRNKSIPIFHLKRWLVKKFEGESSLEEAHVVIVSVGTQRVGFVVDQLIGQEEVVIKPLGKMLHGTPGMAGATITGDGTIALILDVPSMLKRYASNG